MAFDIGSRLEPFVDHFLIDAMRGTCLQLHHPQPAGPTLPLDRPWEGRYCGYFTILQDGPVYRMYYRGHPVDDRDGSPSESTCYAESRDGIHWERPNLGLFEVDGTKDNNIILKGIEPLSHNFAPFLDIRPDVPSSERYKAVAGVHETGLIPFVSEDGIHWRKLRDEPIITQGELDSHNLVFWSESEESGRLRSIARCISVDFVTWTDIEPMAFGDTPMEELYTNQTLPYFRAPHVYLAIAARFMRDRRALSAQQFAALGGEGHYGDDCSDAVLLTSRGGTRYDRTFMEAFVRPGIGLSNWTSRTNYPAHGLIPTGDSEMSFYITRNYGQPTIYLERMALRLDGFASVHAPYAGGEMITHPIRFAGKELVLNCATSAAGSIRVEVQDASGTPLPGYTLEEAHEIVGDEIARRVAWTSGRNPAGIGGRPVRLRFVMKDADLYSLRFT